MNAASEVWTTIGGGDTQTLLVGKTNVLYALAGGGDAKTLQFLLALHYQPLGEIFTT